MKKEIIEGGGVILGAILFGLGCDVDSIGFIFVGMICMFLFTYIHFARKEDEIGNE
jgi:hypothetical protein